MSLKELTNFLKTHTIYIHTHVALEFVRLVRNLYVAIVAWLRDVDVLQVSSFTETRWYNRHTIRIKAYLGIRYVSYYASYSGFLRSLWQTMHISISRYRRACKKLSELREFKLKSEKKFLYKSAIENDFSFNQSLYTEIQLYYWAVSTTIQLTALKY